MTRQTAAERRDHIAAALAQGAEDERIGRETIEAYHQDLVDKARAAVADAQTILTAHESAQAEWQSTGRLPDRGHLGTEAFMVSAYASGQYMQIARQALDRRGDEQLRQAALAAKDRLDAVDRYLAAAGYDIPGRERTR